MISTAIESQPKSKRGGKREGSGRPSEGGKRERYLQRKYGLTEQVWLQMFEAQSSRCAICLTTAPGGNGKWSTDHCHKSDKLRSILCTGCNTALGLAKDSVPILKKMIDYLEQHGNAKKRDWLYV